MNQSNPTKFNEPLQIGKNSLLKIETLKCFRSFSHCLLLHICLIKKLSSLVTETVSFYLVPSIAPGTELRHSLFIRRPINHTFLHSHISSAHPPFPTPIPSYFWGISLSISWVLECVSHSGFFFGLSLCLSSCY